MHYALYAATNPCIDFSIFTFANDYFGKTCARKVQSLKVPKRELYDRSDFPDFYTIKSSWVGDLLVKILT
jgi:hypothetical protein